jgi:Nucleotidyl transferase of unknown function (DUF2204)
MQLPPDLAAMLSELAAERVRYLIIGGHAVGLHARPRSTKDLDLWLDAARPNVARACEALRRFGVPSSIIDDLRAASPDEIVWMGRVPARVDFLFTIPGVSFSTAWARRVELTVGGIPLHVIGREDLLANKRATGRPQDLRDARAIERVRSKKGK